MLTYEVKLDRLFLQYRRHGQSHREHQPAFIRRRGWSMYAYYGKTSPHKQSRGNAQGFAVVALIQC